VLRRRAAEGKRPHTVNTTLVCRIGSVDSQFFPSAFSLARCQSYAQLSWRGAHPVHAGFIGAGAKSAWISIHGAAARRGARL